MRNAISIILLRREWTLISCLQPSLFQKSLPLLMAFSRQLIRLSLSLQTTFLHCPYTTLHLPRESPTPYPSPPANYCALERLWTKSSDFRRTERFFWTSSCVSGMAVIRWTGQLPRSHNFSLRWPRPQTCSPHSSIKFFVSISIIASTMSVFLSECVVWPLFWAQIPLGYFPCSCTKAK